MLAKGVLEICRCACRQAMPATERLLQSEGLPGINVTQVWPVVWAVKQAVQVTCILLGDRVEKEWESLLKQVPLGQPSSTGSWGTVLGRLTTADGTLFFSPSRTKGGISV